MEKNTTAVMTSRIPLDAPVAGACILSRAFPDRPAQRIWQLGEHAERGLSEKHWGQINQSINVCTILVLFFDGKALGLKKSSTSRLLDPNA